MITQEVSLTLSKGDYLDLNYTTTHKDEVQFSISNDWGNGSITTSKEQAIKFLEESLKMLKGE